VQLNNNSAFKLLTLARPITGLLTVAKYLQIAKDPFEKKKIITIAAYLAASGGTSATLDPTTNMAFASTLASFFTEMKKQIANSANNTNEVMFIRNISGCRYRYR
jgi:hypothetical protein